MTLLGLLRAESAGYRSPVDIFATIDALYRNTEWVDNIGDVGLLLWLSSGLFPEVGYFLRDFRLRERPAQLLGRSKAADDGTGMVLDRT